jgi:hypothetical protein
MSKQSYFVRHTQALRVRDEDLKALWKEDRIAVHYPDPGGVLGEHDSSSTDPEDYRGTGKMAMKHFQSLSKSGGYVWAESFVSGDGSAKIGCVKPGTPIQLTTDPQIPIDARWDLRGRPDDFPKRSNRDLAVLKTLKLSKTKPVERYEQMGLRAGRPRQGTIKRWNCGTRLEDLVEGRDPKKDWPNLSPEQQEAVCAEFLRLQQRRDDLPRLRYLLLPVGRTLKDVDIYGLADDGRKIFAQVTYHSRDSNSTQEKVRKLQNYGQEGAHLVFFGRGGGSPHDSKIRFVPVEEVEKWIEDEPPEYGNALFGG